MNGVPLRRTRPPRPSRLTFLLGACVGLGFGAYATACNTCPEPDVYDIPFEAGSHEWSPTLSSPGILGVEDARLIVGTAPATVEVEFTASQDGVRYRVELGMVEQDWVVEP